MCLFQLLVSLARLFWTRVQAGVGAQKGAEVVEVIKAYGNFFSFRIQCVIHNLFSSFNSFSRPYFVYVSIPVKYERLIIHWVEHRLSLVGFFFLL